MNMRVSAGWIDYLIAFLPPYVVLTFLVGADELIVRPFEERTLYSARYYFAIFGLGFLYFGIVEGFLGAGLGKRLKGLHVVRCNGRTPGIVRALIRIIIPIGCIEGVHIPLLLATIYRTEWSALQTAWFTVVTVICPWVAVLLTLRARRENGFATVWDLASGTRVVVKPKGTVRPSIEPAAGREIPEDGAESLGPYKIIEEIVPGKWIAATDPVLRRQVWLLRRASSELSLARRSVARSGRLRWLQKVEAGEATWDAFEATEGLPFRSLIEGGKRLPWSSLRHWLHDLASELWDATGDETLAAELSLDHVWVATQGHAVLLDESWPGAQTRAERIKVGDIAGQQRSLSAVASCAESTTMPLHARAVLKNLAEGKFEKLSFLTGILRGLLDKPAEVSKGIRAGSIFMLSLYIWVTVFVGLYQGAEWLREIVGDSVAWIAMIAAMGVLGAIALIQLVELALFRTTAGHGIFRLALVDIEGQCADKLRLLRRWAIVWVPLLIPMLVAVFLIKRAELTAAFILAAVSLVLWSTAAVYAVIVPNRGIHDWLAGTWVVRR